VVHHRNALHAHEINERKRKAARLSTEMTVTDCASDGIDGAGVHSSGMRKKQTGRTIR
jgi:hypothetical protein